MKYHEFQSKFAKLPFAKRGVILNFAKYGTLTILGLYQSIKENRAVLLPLTQREADLLKIAEEGLDSLTPPHNE